MACVHANQVPGQGQVDEEDVERKLSGTQQNRDGSQPTRKEEKQVPENPYAPKRASSSREGALL
ncbi:hypothetical protein KSB_87110 [Ktedonobacter robiniae]|uniref:Uncharacterized protein n=1 Tax=Ktedonobacter robiniae TaxID=2778365 RepID=A0ABQ3V4Y0_9CHLR|nr:hypothetical protein KSB_87110 [Ktedonobacter robiniae]